MKRISYIANQLYPEGLDELQLLLICRQYGLHAALSGPPGTGKTECVRQVARILAAPLFAKTCSARTGESQIISYPALERDGEATVTVYRNGPLVQAMEAGGIFYADEFNLLKEDVQKRLNSAIDDRRSIDRIDGVIVQATEGFWTTISYNPSRSITSRDLEESVADRFVHLNFRAWDARFLGFVSQQRSARLRNEELPSPRDAALSLGTRAIADDGRFLDLRRDGAGTRWYDSLANTPADSHAPAWVYRVHDPENRGARLQEMATARVLSTAELGQQLSRLVTIVEELSENGTSPLIQELGLSELHRQEDAQLLSVHRSGVRIVSAALVVHDYLREHGMVGALAQSIATRLVVDQTCYGHYRDRKMTSMTSLALVSTLARALGLFTGATRLNTDFSVPKRA